MKIIVLFVAGLIGAVFTATIPETAGPTLETETLPTDIQPPITNDQASNLDATAHETKNLPDSLNGLLSNPDALQKSLEKMKQKLPPSLRGMLDKQIANMGGPENLQKTINEQIQKFGGIDKMQEAVQEKMKNLQGMMGNFGGVMGGHNPLFAHQPTGGIQFDNAAIPEPKKLNLTDKEGLKKAVDEMKNKMPEALREIVDKKIGDFDGSLPDLSHVGIDKFPTTKEEFKDAITKVKEQLPQETKEMLEKVQEMRSSMKGNPLASMLGGAGNMQNMIQKLMGGGNPMMALLGQNAGDPNSMKTQLLSSIMRQMQQRKLMNQQRMRDQQIMQMHRMHRHQMRRPIMRRPTPPRMEVIRQRPVTVNININPGMVVDMHDISPAGLRLLQSMYRFAPGHESHSYRPMPRERRWPGAEMRRPRYPEYARRPVSRGIERLVINDVFNRLSTF